MRFIADETLGPIVIKWLRKLHHNVLSIYEDFRGLNDDEILQKSFEDNRILITNDKDFGEMVFRQRKSHSGVILLRLDDERSTNTIEVLDMLLGRYASQLVGNFVVATESTVRVVHLRND